MTPRARVIPLFIPHLGCPHDCVFCNQKRISGALAPVGPEDVALAIEEGLKKCPEPPEAAFYGGSFTAIPVSQQEALLGAAAPYLKSGRISSLRLSTRPDAIDIETLERLRAYCVATVELGCQSMDDEVLRQSGRGHTAEDTVRAAELIRSFGFTLILQMMTGLPGSTPEKDVESARRIAALRPDGVRIYPTVIIRDTELFELWKRGEYRQHSVEDAVSVCAEILPIFESAKIKVIRLGLNPTDDLSGGQAVAGAYHPALGELVKSRIFLNKALRALDGTAPGGGVVIGVSPSCVSQMTGQRRCNVKALCETLGLRSVKIVPADVPAGEISIISASGGEI